MSDIVIKGMEMPTEEQGNLLLLIKPNVAIVSIDNGKYRNYEVEELPPHGRLIDADRLTQVMKGAILISNNGDLKDNLMKLVGECTIDYLKESPTILEASKQ